MIYAVEQVNYARISENDAFLKARVKGFSLEDEYKALENSVVRFGFDSEEVEKEMESRIEANFVTYCLERDTDMYEWTYELKQDGGLWVLTTNDHSYYCMSQMALNALMKARRGGGDEDYNRAMFFGTVALRNRLIEAGDGERVMVVYPPIKGSDQTMIYVYEVEVLSNGDRRITAKGKAMNMSLDGVRRFYGEVFNVEVTNRGTNYFVANPRRLTEGIGYDELVGYAKSLVKLDVNYESSLNMDVFFRREDLSNDYVSQLLEGGKFVTKCLMDKYNDLNGSSLRESDLEDLEMAFSFARRAVGNVYNRGFVLTAEALMSDYEVRKRLEGADYVDPQIVEAYNNRLIKLYGVVEEFYDRDAGCEGGLMNQITLETLLNPLMELAEGAQILEDYGECVELSCPACHKKPIEEGATRCPRCGWSPGKDRFKYRDKYEQMKVKEREKVNCQVVRERLKNLKVKSQILIKDPTNRHNLN